MIKVVLAKYFVLNCVIFLLIFILLIWLIIITQKNLFDKFIDQFELLLSTRPEYLNKQAITSANSL